MFPYVYHNFVDQFIFVVLHTLSNLTVSVIRYNGHKKHWQYSTSNPHNRVFVGDIMLICDVPIRIMEYLRADFWAPVNCIIFVVVRYIPLYIGINTIMLVAVERFVAIVLPIHFRSFVAPDMVKLQLLFVWLLTLAEIIFPACVVQVNNYSF